MMLQLLFDDRLKTVLYSFAAAFACHAVRQHCNQLGADLYSKVTA